MGARSFDIRANATKDDASAADVKIVHGGDIMAVSGKRRKRSYITVNPQYFSWFLREA